MWGWKRWWECAAMVQSAHLPPMVINTLSDSSRSEKAQPPAEPSNDTGARQTRQALSIGSLLGILPHRDMQRAVHRVAKVNLCHFWLLLLVTLAQASGCRRRSCRGRCCICGSCLLQCGHGGVADTSQLL
jgi:hypothetical protein